MKSKRIFSGKKEMIVQDGFDCLVLFLKTFLKKGKVGVYYVRFFHCIAIRRAYEYSGGI